MDNKNLTEANKMKEKPLEVLIFEDEVNEYDLRENFSEYPETTRFFECGGKGEKAIGEFMKIVEKESKFPVNITCRVEYQAGLSDLAKGKDIIITDIGLRGPKYRLPNPDDMVDSDKIYGKIVGGFEMLYGKDWFENIDRNYIPWQVFKDPADGLYELASILREKKWEEMLDMRIAGLQITKELENQGRKITMYTMDLTHQPGIHWGLLDGIISPEEFVEIYEKYKGKRVRGILKLTSMNKRKPEVVVINNGRIAIGIQQPRGKSVKDYVKVIEIAKNYQLGK